MGKESVRSGVGQKITSINEIEELLIQVPASGISRLGDIVTIKRSYLEPQNEALYYNKPGLTLGLSNESGINVVKLGERLDEKLAELLQKELPAGFDVNQIYYPSDRVDAAVIDFMLNLAMSVGIVIVVLMFAMGLRSGLLISNDIWKWHKCYELGVTFRLVDFKWVNIHYFWNIDCDAGNRFTSTPFYVGCHYSRYGDVGG